MDKIRSAADYVEVSRKLEEALREFNAFVSKVANEPKTVEDYAFKIYVVNGSYNIEYNANSSAEVRGENGEAPVLYSRAFGETFEGVVSETIESLEYDFEE